MTGFIEENSVDMGRSAFQMSAMSHEIALTSKAESTRADEVSTATTTLRTTSDLVNQLAETAVERSSRTDSHAHDGRPAAGGECGAQLRHLGPNRHEGRVQSTRNDFFLSCQPMSGGRSTGR